MAYHEYLFSYIICTRVETVPVEQVEVDLSPELVSDTPTVEHKGKHLLSIQFILDQIVFSYLCITYELSRAHFSISPRLRTTTR